MATKYLVRFDDICPTMNWEVWQEVERVLIAHDIKPILAVVPDNRDDVLRVSLADDAFWDRVRAWRDRGWTIAMHGYQHGYVTHDPGIVGFKNDSEFAGLSREIQGEKLRAAMQTFNREGICPDMWVAPSHSFDRTTADLLREMGVTNISDGYFLLPNRESTGSFWIPMQLWRFPFRPLPFGVWTVCMHINSWKPRDILQFQRDARRYQGNLSSVPEMIALYGDRRRDWRDKVFETAYPRFLRASYKLHSWLTRVAPALLGFNRARRARRHEAIAGATGVEHE